MRSKRTRESSRLPVLALGANDVEWLPVEPGEPGAQAAHAARRPRELAAAARAAFEQSARHAGRTVGRRAPTCILALGTEFLHERLIELPPLPPRDRKAVLRRKAAALAGCSPEEVIFTASLQGSPSHAGTEPGDRWLIVALRRSFASELLSSLRTRGIRIARVVSLRLAPLREALASQRVRNLDSGCVVVAVEQKATTVSLVAGTALVSQSTLTGSIAARPKLARALLQEIRSIDSFWRKTHRGVGVTEVAWIGLAAERGEPLRAALQTALPDARVHALVTEAEGTDARGLAPGRVQLLTACRRAQGFVLDLCLSSPRSLGATVASVAAVSVLFLSVGVVAHNRLGDTREQLEDRFLTLRREEQVVAAELERSSRARELVDGVRSRLVRAEEVSRAGLPFEHIVESAFSAFGADGALLSLTAFQPPEQAQDGTAVVISGWTDPHPLHGAQRIAAIAEALAKTPGLTVERVEPPAELPGLDRNGRVRPLPFLVRLRAGRGVDLEPLPEETP